MKKIILFYLLNFFCLAVFAQEPQEMTIAGIKVVLQPSVKDVVSVQLFLNGGTANYTQEQQGIEALALDVATQGGTTQYNKNAFFSELEKVGSEIYSSNNYDYSVVSLKCLKQYFNQSWNLYADAINNPAFSQTEFDNIKNQRLTAAKANESNPDNHLRNMAMKNTFANQNYSKNPEGTPQTIESLTLDQVKSYFANLKTKDKAVLVIVGDVDANQLNEKIVAAFGNWTTAGKNKVSQTKLAMNNSALSTESREIATNYIRGCMPAPKLGTKDEVAMRVAMSILDDRYFDEIRTKRNLSYAPSAFFPAGIIENPYLVVYVTTDKPNEAIQVMTDEIRKIRKVGFDATELINKKGEFLTYHYMKQETNASLADDIGRAAISPGGLAHRAQFIDMVNKLSVEDINEAFEKYTTAINWSYLGDETIVDKAIFVAPIVEQTSKIEPIKTKKSKMPKPKRTKKAKGSNKRGF